MQRSKILLLSVNRERNPQPVFPLGLQFLQSICAEANFDTRFLDWNTMVGGATELREQVRTYQPNVALLSIRNIDSIESAGTRYYVPDAVDAVRAIRAECSCCIVLGGSGYSLFPERLLLETGADYGVKGPGETILVNLLNILLSQKAPTDLPGIVYRSGNTVVVNEPAPPSSVACSPNRPSDLLRWYWNQGALVNIQTARGCPCACIYCTYPKLEGPRVINRAIVEVVDEMQLLYEAHGVDQFFIVDSVFNIVPETPDRLAEELLHRKLRVQWTAHFLPTGIDVERVRLWKRAGLSSIEFGVDTLSESLLPRYGKNFRIDDVKKAAESCSSNRVPYAVYLILGGPGETETTLEETVSHCDSLPTAVFIALVGMRIYPNTKLHALAIKEKFIGTDTDLLTPVFYLSPLLDPTALTSRLARLGKRVNWLITGHGLEEREQSASIFRKHGYRGSLWEHCTPAE